MEKELLHLENLKEKMISGWNGVAIFSEMKTLLEIVERAIESGDTSELEEWAR